MIAQKLLRSSLPGTGGVSKCSSIAPNACEKSAPAGRASTKRLSNLGTALVLASSTSSSGLVSVVALEWPPVAVLLGVLQGVLHLYSLRQLPRRALYQLWP